MIYGICVIYYVHITISFESVIMHKAKFVHFEVGCAALYCYVTKSYFVIVSC